MKVLSKLSLVVIAVIALMSTSCNDKNDSFKYWVSYGEVQIGEDYYRIILDNGKILYVTETAVPPYSVQDGQRVVANYTILETMSDGYNVRLNAISEIRTKDVLYKSQLSEEQLAELGDDPVNIVGSAWFSAGKYLNVDFEVLYSSNDITHILNLVVDDENSTPDEKIVEFRHNALGDIPFHSGRGCVSFRVEDLIPEGKDEVNVVLKWRNYRGEERSENMVLKRDRNSLAESNSPGSRIKGTILVK